METIMMSRIQGSDFTAVYSILGFPQLWRGDKHLCVITGLVYSVTATNVLQVSQMKPNGCLL